MGEQTKIQWTTHTFNPWRGCTKVSPGCTNCYAETLSGRNPKVLGVWGPQGTRPVASESYWRQPVKWNRDADREGVRARVFCASLCDVFEDVPETYAAQIAEARVRLWDLIRATPCLDWQLLTKRPENIPSMLPAGNWPNVWLGTSVENQQYLHRLDQLQDVQDSVRVPVLFCSAEPLLGPLSFGATLRGIHWVIVGGESGPEARTCWVSWVVSIIAQCKVAKVACFVKQLGANIDNNGHMFPLAVLHAKGGDIEEWSPDLQVREFPS